MSVVLSELNGILLFQKIFILTPMRIYKNTRGEGVGGISKLKFFKETMRLNGISIYWGEGGGMKGRLDIFWNSIYFRVFSPDTGG